MSELRPSPGPPPETPWNSPDLLHKIVELADDAIIVVDRDHRITLFNQGAERIFEYSNREALGQSLDLLLPARLAEIHRRHIQDFAASHVSARGMNERQRLVGLRKSGAEFPAEASISKVVVGGALSFTVILRDITERIRAEEEIRATLREKEALLQEIHHRVKNNLQVVASLLALQARSVADDSTRKMFEESHNRIHSMALLHENLYRSSDLSRIAFAGYVQSLANHLFRYYEIDKHVLLKVDVDDIYLNLDAAIPCGLIINELVSNSLKHAFPAGRSGTVRIALHKRPGSQAELEVADDGVGFPGPISSAQSLGLRLVRMLADQLNGRIELHSPPGASVRLTFPLA